MTNIGRSDGGAVGGGAGGSQNRYGTQERQTGQDRFGQDRLGNRDRAGDVARLDGARSTTGHDLMTDLGSGLFDPSLADDRSAFERSMRQAARAIQGDTGEQDRKAAPDDAASSEAARVLAVAQGMVGTGLPAPADAAAVPGPVPSASVEAFVARANARIEQAIRAEAAPVAGRPLNLRIAFEGQIEGLRAIQIVASPMTLDILLERGGTAATPELIQAAEALAERLAMRMSKRTVRILDQPAGAVAAKPEGPAAGAHFDPFRPATS